MGIFQTMKNPVRYVTREPASKKICSRYFVINASLSKITDWYVIRCFVIKAIIKKKMFFFATCETTSRTSFTRKRSAR